MPSEKDSANKKAEIKVPIEVNTSKGKLTQFDFYLSYKEMSDAMTIFLLDSKRAKKIRGEDDYNNIYMPINSAIQKANIDINELDYILLIGGSAQSHIFRNLYTIISRIQQFLCRKTYRLMSHRVPPFILY